MKSFQARHELNLVSWSDIQMHLPLLYKGARGHVLELGVRFGVSTITLIAGVEVHGGHVWSVDIDPDCLYRVGESEHWTFICADSCDAFTIDAAGLPDKLDMLFIDTEHTQDRTFRELVLWGSRVKPGGAILLHDVYDGSTFPGVLEAIKDYCDPRGLQCLLYPHSYGLGEIRIPGSEKKKRKAA